VNRFEDESIDILHIDGLHTYEAVSQDFNSWLPKLAPGAHVLLHDIKVRVANFGVYRLWEEVQGKFPSLEFFHSNGLGVLELPGDSKSAFICDISELERSAMALLFSQLGETITREFRLTQTEREVGQLRHDLMQVQNSKSWRLTGRHTHF
jgi:hypothetical protein